MEQLLAQIEANPVIVNGQPSEPIERSDGSLKAPWKRKSRAIVGRRYQVGMVTKAGTLLSYRRSFNPSDRHTIAKFTCSQVKCGREAECRMDKYLDVNTSCGCLKDANVGRMIETVINSIPENVRENISKELELGKRSQYSIGELAVHFQLFGSFARCAMTRMRKRWAETEWTRLGEKRMKAIWRSVQKIGVSLTAKRYFHGMVCTVLVACRWFRLNYPAVSTFQPA
jgi:hypothetical protein